MSDNTESGFIDKIHNKSFAKSNDNDHRNWAYICALSFDCAVEYITKKTRVLKTYFLQFPLLKNSNYIIIIHTIYFDKFFANHNIKYLVLHNLYRTNYFVTEIYLQIYLYFVSHTHTHVLYFSFFFIY